MEATICLPENDFFFFYPQNYFKMTCFDLLTEHSPSGQVLVCLLPEERHFWRFRRPGESCSCGFLGQPWQQNDFVGKEMMDEREEDNRLLGFEWQLLHLIIKFNSNTKGSDGNTSREIANERRPWQSRLNLWPLLWATLSASSQTLGKLSPFFQSNCGKDKKKHNHSTSRES